MVGKKWEDNMEHEKLTYFGWDPLIMGKNNSINYRAFSEAVDVGILIVGKKDG